MRARLPASFAAALLVWAPLSVQAEVVLSPPEWSIGRMEMSEPVSKVVTVSNTGGEPVVVTFVTTCGCLEALPQRFELEPAAAAPVEMRYTPGEPGRISVAFVVSAAPVRGGEGSARLFRVTGMADPPAFAPAAAPPAGAGEAQLRLYYAPGCRSCEQLIARLQERLSALPPGTATLVRRNVLEPEAFEELAAAAGASAIDALPALVARGRVLAGAAAIEAGLEEVLSAAAAGPVSPPAPGGAADIARGLAAPALFAAGLVDGVNPCAFTTMIFLLTTLVLAGRRRGEILAVGAAFTAAVFATYLLVGLGFFHALRAASSFPVAAAILRWGLAAVLVALAGLSLYDYALVRGGRPAEMVLRLPDPLKRRLQRSILSGVRSTALVGGSLALGAVVSLFELACTGQVYLPAVAWLVRSEGGSRAVALLVVYNLGFILPLALVFVLAARGMSSRRLTALVQAHLGAVKLALAAVFAGLAVLTLAT